MTRKSIKVYAPATIANVGPGFDVLGLAIEKPGDIVTAERIDHQEFIFTLKTQYKNIPNDQNNVAAHVARLMLKEFKPNFGVHVTLEKNMPISSGLGSSGASASATAYAMGKLLNTSMSKMELVSYASLGEKFASGSAHADNVAPSLLGGLCLIRSYQPLEIIQLPYRNEFYWVVAHPELIIETKKARELLPKTIPLSVATEQNGNLAALITGLQMGDARLIGSALQDNIAEPVRAPLIPGYYDIKKCLLHEGAIAFSISGSGPSVFALAQDEHHAQALEKIFIESFKRFAKVDCQVYSSKINTTGAYEIY